MTSDDLERLELPESAAEVSMSHNQPIGVPNLRDGEWSLKAGDRLYTESQVRAILADRQRRAQAAEPVAFCVAGANGKPTFGKGWMFSPVPIEMKNCTMPLYTRAAPAEVTEEMALAFYHALSDGAIGEDDLKEIMVGLKAALGGGR